MMQDKDVGKLWRRINEDCKALDTCPNHGDSVKLIRKLVEERARFLNVKFDMPWDLAKIQACRDFGIDPSTFKR